MLNDYLKIKKRDDNAFSDIVLLTKNQSPAFCESLKAARTNIMYSLSDQENGKCFMITSALASEGKTTTAINLAITMAKTEARVIVIDADLRRPRLHTYLDIQNKEGLANFLGGFCDSSSIIKRNKEQNLDYITAGELPPNPTELLTSKKMEDFVEELKKSYDYIIIDTPPVNAVADSAALAHIIKNIVFVLRCGASTFPEVKKALTSLGFSHSKLLGFITIDQSNKKRSTKYYSKYYSKY